MVGQSGTTVAGALGAGRSRRAVHARARPDRDVARDAGAASRTDQASGRPHNPTDDHVKGYAAPETKAALERARLLIEQAEALGEPPEDPLLLFSVLYGVWVANRVAFNGDAMRELAAQFLALAEKQSATVPLMIGHRIMGVSLVLTGDIAEGRECIRSGDRALRSRRASVRWRPDLPWTWRCRSCAIARWRCGCLAILMPRWRTRNASLKHAREIGQAASLMFALHHSSLTQIHCGNYAAANADATSLPCWRTKRTLRSGRRPDYCGTAAF